MIRIRQRQLFVSFVGSLTALWLSTRIEVAEAFVRPPSVCGATTGIRPNHHCSFWLTAKKKSKKKKTSGATAVGIRGFGGGVVAKDLDKSGSNSNIVSLDTSKDSRQFYERFLDSQGAGDNLKRTSLGFLELADGFQLRGVITTRDIKAKEAIIDIPAPLALNLGPEGNDPTVPAIEFLRQYTEVLRENDLSNPLLHYFRMLPGLDCPDCQTSTDFFSDAALDALQYPLMIQETKQRRQRVQAALDQLLKNSYSNDFCWIDNGPLQLQHLQWAVWLITSRILTVQNGDGRTYSKLLIPYLDMCNHCSRSENVLTGRTDGRLKVMAGKAVPRGEQVTIRYGSGPPNNVRFLQDYGFLDQDDGYTVMAQLLMYGQSRLAPNVKKLSEPDRLETLDCLQTTTLEQDAQLLQAATEVDMRTAIQFRMGVKNELKTISSSSSMPL